MAEVLGIVASAVQLTQVSIAVVTTLSNFFVQIRDAPEVLQSRLLQIQTLIEISRLVACMPQLQTAEIETTLRNCLKEAKTLKDVLQGLAVEKDGSRIKKWLKIVSGLPAEKRILGLLQSLEVEKSALSLCITRIDSWVELGLHRQRKVNLKVAL